MTRDKTLGRMTEDLWSTVIDINLIAPQRIDQELFEREAVREQRPDRVRLVDQRHRRQRRSDQLLDLEGGRDRDRPGMGAAAGAEREVTINAVAPGFIETQMTAAMPIVIREAGRRMNSLAQGGLPVDVAETIAWFASPASGGVTGNVVRVCGQSLIGA